MASSRSSSTYLTLLLSCFACSRSHTEHLQYFMQRNEDAAHDGIAYATRAHWMRIANQAPVNLISPCSFAPFGSAIVNHTSQTGLGKLVCLGANNISSTGNPTLHGEIAAIDNCTAILTDTHGPYGYAPSDVSTAWSDLSLYTNAESCPMCASAIRWAGFKEYVYGSSIETLIAKGWSQITISSYDIFQQSLTLGTVTSYLEGVLENETDPSFSWQFSKSYPCPRGCSRNAEGVCSPA
jgi:tRNA(Arg) A34 adenosine deaminase TadA